MIVISILLDCCGEFLTVIIVSLGSTILAATKIVADDQLELFQNVTIKGKVSFVFIIVHQESGLFKDGSNLFC